MSSFEMPDDFIEKGRQLDDRSDQQSSLGDPMRDSGLHPGNVSVDSSIPIDRMHAEHPNFASNRLFESYAGVPVTVEMQERVRSLYNNTFVFDWLGDNTVPPMLETFLKPRTDRILSDPLYPDDLPVLLDAQLGGSDGIAGAYASVVTGITATRILANYSREDAGRKVMSTRRLGTHQLDRGIAAGHFNIHADKYGRVQVDIDTQTSHTVAYDCYYTANGVYLIANNNSGRIRIVDRGGDGKGPIVLRDTPRAIDPILPTYFNRLNGLLQRHQVLLDTAAEAAGIDSDILNRRYTGLDEETANTLREAKQAASKEFKTYMQEHDLPAELRFDLLKNVERLYQAVCFSFYYNEMSGEPEASGLRNMAQRTHDYYDNILLSYTATESPDE